MLHYTNNGVGNTIVFIHGFCENSTCFQRQVFLLKDNYNVVTIDLPGHGKSPIIPFFTMDDLATEIAKVLDMLMVKSCVMIGHSMGGYATLAFAKKQQRYLKGFGLLHSTAAADNDERKQKREQAITLINKNGAEIYTKNFIPPLFAASSSKELILERQMANAHLSALSLTSCLLSMKNREESNVFIAKTELPIAFIIGKLDALIPEKDMLAQAATVNVSHITYLEHSAHMGMLEEPDKVCEGVSKFVRYCFKGV